MYKYGCVRMYMLNAFYSLCSNNIFIMYSMYLLIYVYVCMYICACINALTYCCDRY